MPSFDNQIHDTEFLRKNKTFNLAILKTNNIRWEKIKHHFIIVIFFNHIIMITPKTYIVCTWWGLYTSASEKEKTAGLYLDN